MKMLSFKNLKSFNAVQRQFVRLLITESRSNDDILSFRQKAWIESRKIYENFEHVFYSSHLELEHMRFGEGISKHEYDDALMRKCVSKENRNELWPSNWMEDYEYYDGKNAEAENNSTNNFGTANALIPSSEIPCSGCGAHLHCHKHTKPGFLPVEIFKGRTNNELKTLICQRCHFLKYYNIALDLEVSSEFYVDALSRIEDQFALVVLVIDLLDFPASIWPGMHNLIGPKRPVLVVGNKVDLLPRDCKDYLNHIKECLKGQIIKSGFNKLNVKNVALISAKTGFGIEELINQLQKHWSYKGDVYLTGCTNVGKSSLFNILLNSDYCRPQASSLIRKATTCTWPGTTLQMLRFPIFRPSPERLYWRYKRLSSERINLVENDKYREAMARKFGNIDDAELVGHVGRTFTENANEFGANNFKVGTHVEPISVLNDNSKRYQEARYVYDTPGVMNPAQFTNLMTNEELNLLHPRRMITPRAFRLEPGMSLFVGGLARLDFLRADFTNLDWLQVFLFASPNLPTLIADSDYAESVYRKYIGTPLFRIPFGNKERFERWPLLQTNKEEYKIKGYKLNLKHKGIACSGDIILSSAGWVSVRPPLNVECVFRAWTPEGRGIFLRQPSLIPYADRIIGKRINNSLAYNTSQPFSFKK